MYASPAFVLPEERLYASWPVADCAADWSNRRPPAGVIAAEASKTLEAGLLAGAPITDVWGGDRRGRGAAESTPLGAIGLAGAGTGTGA